MPVHDQLFKLLIISNFSDFLKLFLPELQSYLDESSILAMDKELFSDLATGESHNADLVVRAKIKDSDSFCLVHIEPQSSHKPEFPRRLFNYFARLHEKYTLPVYPIAVLSYPRPHSTQPSSYEIDFPGLNVLKFQFTAIQLNRLKWRDYAGSLNPIAVALLPKMKFAHEERVEVGLECYRLLPKLPVDPARALLIAKFIHTYLVLTPKEMEKLKKEVKKLNKPEQDLVMEELSCWAKQGRQEGLQEGLQQGRTDGMLILLGRQLSRKFGSLEDSLYLRIQRLPLEKLEVLGEAFIDFDEKQDLLTWLDKNT